jgi:TatD DNase family protein
VARREGLPPPRLARRTVGVRSARTREANVVGHGGEVTLLIDAHAHMDRYEDELEDAVAEIDRCRIFTISTSMNIRSYLRNLEIARTSDLILPVFGVHPWNAQGYTDRLDEIEPYIAQSPILGEVGLDYHFVKHAHRYPAQRRVFEVFVRAAAEQGKVLNTHTTGAEEEVLGFLDRYGIQRAIIHWYAGPLDILDEMISRGYYFTVGIELMHSDAIRTIAQRIPTDLILTETDNPGAMKWLSGRIGMPSAIEEVIACLAGLKGVTAEEAAETVHTNLRGLLGYDPSLPERFRSLLLG